MLQVNSILVATDTRLEDDAALDRAADLTRSSGASLTIVDVVPEFSWTTRLTIEKHEHLTDLLMREKKERLEVLASPIRERGFRVQTKVLAGRTSAAIIREVLEARHDLVVRIAKGVDSRRAGRFGTTAVRLLQECPCAVWLVMPEATRGLDHVLGCVNTSDRDPLDDELNEKVYRVASMMSRFHDAKLSIVHAWHIFGEQLLRNRVDPREFEEMRNQIEQQFEEFLATHGSEAHEMDAHLIKGAPSSVIPEFVERNDVDLVVLGTVARSLAARAIVGNTAERILGRLDCSLLALKPDRFVSPVTVGDYVGLAGGTAST